MPNELELKIKQIIQRAPNVKSLRLEIECAVFKAGQFLCATLKSDKECKRYLSISSSPTEKGYIEFTKRITQSDFSRLLDSLKPEDRLKIQYPFGNFTLEGAPQRIAFLSGGIGITPIRSMVKFAVDKNLGIDIVLLYANRSINDIVFKDDFDGMQKAYSKLRVAHVLCEPAPGFICTVGLINAQVIKNEIPDYAQRRFYICGPPAMVEAMKKILADELGCLAENIILERFQGY
jgi:glycine betaine catabolism B